MGPQTIKFMSRSAAILSATAVVAATFCYINLDLAAFGSVEPREAAGIAVLVVLAVFSDAFGIEVSHRGGREHTASIAFIPMFSAAILFPPAIAVMAAAASELTAYLGIRRLAPWKALFNAAQTVLALTLATGLLQLLEGPYWIERQIGFVPFLAFVITAFAINVLLVGVALAVLEHRPLLGTIRFVAGNGGGNVIYGLLASPLAYITAVLYQQFYIAGLVLIVLPLLLIRSSYRTQLRLERANEDLLRVLIKAIETRDPYTSGHSIRVSTLARAIAEDLGLSGRKIEDITKAGLLHDIGKIDSVYATLIQKPTDLTDEERRIVRMHATKGAEILATLSSFGDTVVEGVRHHHERFDGTGYPSGLKGQDTPVAARIIMLCDSIDAMLSDRPYRRALTISQVHQELTNHAGTQFDPEIVQIILNRRTLERAACLVNGDSAATARHSTALQNA